MGPRAASAVRRRAELNETLHQPIGDERFDLRPRLVGSALGHGEAEELEGQRGEGFRLSPRGYDGEAGTGPGEDERRRAPAVSGLILPDDPHLAAGQTHLIPPGLPAVRR